MINLIIETAQTNPLLTVGGAYALGALIVLLAWLMYSQDD